MAGVNEQITSAAELDALPPLQLMVLEVLAARYRLGEVLWTFTAHTSTVRAIRALEAAGLVTSMGGIVPRTIRASLTPSGVASATSPTYRVPDQPQRVQPSREDVARLAMGILGCEMDTDIPECPSCDGSVPCYHPEVGYCIVHDDLSADGMTAVGAPCPTAVRLADAVLALFGQQPTVAEVRQELIARIESELDHAHFNGHYLDTDCQGVAPGERVPAVRVSNIRAVFEFYRGER